MGTLEPPHPRRDARALHDGATDGRVRVVGRALPRCWALCKRCRMPPHLEPVPSTRSAAAAAAIAAGAEAASAERDPFIYNPFARSKGGVAKEVPYLPADTYARGQRGPAAVADVVGEQAWGERGRA